LAKKLKDLSVVEASMKGEGGGDIYNQAQGKVIYLMSYKSVKIVVNSTLKSLRKWQKLIS